MIEHEQPRRHGWNGIDPHVGGDADSEPLHGPWETTEAERAKAMADTSKPVTFEDAMQDPEAAWEILEMDGDTPYTGSGIQEQAADASQTLPASLGVSAQEGTGIWGPGHWEFDAVSAEELAVGAAVLYQELVTHAAEVAGYGGRPVNLVVQDGRIVV